MLSPFEDEWNAVEGCPLLNVALIRKETKTTLKSAQGNPKAPRHRRRMQLLMFLAALMENRQQVYSPKNSSSIQYEPFDEIRAASFKSNEACLMCPTCLRGKQSGAFKISQIFVTKQQEAAGQRG